jgi:hypothetical protein
VTEHVQLGVGPFDELAIHPDKAVKLIERDGCHDNLLRARTRQRFYSNVEVADARLVTLNLDGYGHQDKFMNCAQARLKSPFRSQSVEKLGKNYQRA